MTAFRVHYAVATEHGQVARSRLARRALHSEQQRRGRRWTRETLRCLEDRERMAAAMTGQPQQTPTQTPSQPHAISPAATAPQSRARDCNGRCFDRVWSKEMAALFLAGLAAIGNVRAVSRQIGVSSQTLYRRRRADPAFSVHWMRALSRYLAELEDMLFQIALHGEREEKWYRGYYAGTVTRYDHQLALQLLYLHFEREREARNYSRQMLVSMESAMDWARVRWTALKRHRQNEADYQAQMASAAEEEDWGDADYPCPYEAEANKAYAAGMADDDSQYG